jgi:hypothetical protein
MSFGLKALKSCKLGAPQFHIFAQVKMSRLCANDLCLLSAIGKSGQCKMTQMFLLLITQYSSLAVKSGKRVSLLYTIVLIIQYSIEWIFLT